MAFRILLVVSLALASRFAAAQSVPVAAEPANPQTWGTAAGYTTKMAHDFSGETPNCCDPPKALQQYLGATYCPTERGLFESVQAQAQVDVPDGARLAQLQFWAYDVDPDDGLTVDFWETCQAPGLNAPVSTKLATADSFGAIGTYFGFTPLDDHRVNARDCAYSVRVWFNPSGGYCKGSAIQLQKVQVSWVRDVAPSPQFPTFADVPTDHPFFQYIEALASSGVTGGCGSNNYCPDAPLTRGQMATFLSRALGLEWP